MTPIDEQNSPHHQGVNPAGYFITVLFGGSRFIVWALTPFLLLFAVVVPLMMESWTPEKIIQVVGMEVFIILLVLALLKPTRFRWAGRGVTGIVFLIYLASLADELFIHGWHFVTFQSLYGFFIIGLPCLYNTLGGFIPRRPR